MAPPIRIRIGGEVDPSLARSLASAHQMVSRSERQIQREKKATTAVADQEARKQLRAQQQLAAASDSLSRQRARALYQLHTSSERSAERSARAEERSRARAEANARREIERTLRAAVRAAEQEARARDRAESRSRDRFGRRTSHRATRFLMPEAPIGPMVTRGLSGMARGAGLDFSLESNIAKVAEFETAIIGLRNQARTAGKPMRGSGGSEIKSAADLLGYGRTETANAVGAFATKTGDVNLGLDSIRELARRAAATNASLGDMMDAAADVANGLGDIPNKSAKMLETIDGFIVQGARGAVEIKDMASKMPKYAASAGRFEGDTSQNMLKLGALGQLARSTGGATSAAEAATSVARFADTFGTNARAKQFKKKGINIFGADNQIRDPLQLIREALTATKGDQLEMGKLFASSLGVRSVRGLSTAYNKAGGGDAGMKAVNDMLDGFMKDLKLSDDVLKQNLADRDSSIQVRAQKFNNKLEDITAAMASKTLPALEKLEGPLLRAAEALSGLVQSAVDHPWAAVGLAISAAVGASIARAGLESLFRAAIERALSRTPMPFSGGGVQTAGGAALGTLRNGGWRNSVLLGAGAGIVADVAWNQADAQNEQLKRESGGMGFGDLMWESLKSGRTPFEVVDAQMNQKAKADAAARDQGLLTGIGETSAQTGPNPVVQQLQSDNAALQRELQQSRQVQQQMLEQLTAIAGKPGTPAPSGGRVDQ